MQIGLGQNRVTLEQVTGGQERFIDALTVGIANNQVEAVAKHSQLPYQQAKELLEKLQPIIKTTTTTTSDDRTLSTFQPPSKKLRKCNQLTPQSCMSAQLQQITGISNNIACCITATYGTVANLVRTFDENTYERFNATKSKPVVRHLQLPGAKRCIGIEVEKRIHTMLFGT